MSLIPAFEAVLILALYRIEGAMLARIETDLAQQRKTADRPLPA